MSTQEHYISSSLNNLPEHNARLMSSGTSAGSIGDMNSPIDREIPIPTDTWKNNAEEQGPIDKQGDTWGGGISGYNHEFR